MPNSVVDSSDSSDFGQEEFEPQEELSDLSQLLQESEALKQEISTESLEKPQAEPSFSIMSVSPGNYSPENWSSGYRIVTSDSQDKRAELFNDFSYWMVRKFQIEIDTRHSNDTNIISLVNSATNSIAGNRTSINWLSDRRTEMANTDSGLLTSINWLKARNLEKDGSIGEIYKITGALQNTSSSQGTSISWLGDRRVEMLSSIDDLYTLSSANNTSVVWLRDRRNEMQNSIDEIYTVTAVNTAKNALQDVSVAWLKEKQLVSEASILELYALSSGNNTVNGVQSESIQWLKNRQVEDTTSINDIYSLTSTMNTNISRNNNDITLLDQKINSLDIKDYTSLLTAMNANQLLTTSSINSASTKNAENLTFINASLKSLENYDDTSFKKLIIDSFSADSLSYENGVNSSDGVFTKVVKGQFTRLIAELNRQLTLSITATTDNIDAFETYLREEFALLNDWASLQVEWSIMINDNILVVIEALNKIVAKPNGDVNVNVPTSVFDFDRLQQILSELSFGNLVNEAGTNLWDVLKQLIDSLGGVVESIVKIVPDLIKELIALVIPEDKEFFSKKLTALTDSFDSKFSGVMKLSDSVKNIYSEPKSMNSISYTIFDVEMKLIPDFMLSKIGSFRTVMGALIYLGTFINIYKRFVGQGDVIQ